MQGKRVIGRLVACAGLLCLGAAAFAAEPLGLPAVPVPADNPITDAKVKLGEKLFNDKRFSSTGEVACANCHDAAKAFTDSPLSVSEGINKLTGTRNAPTVVNAAFLDSQFWDGREPTLEAQSKQPFLNPVEMALPNHEPIIEVVKGDREYRNMFKKAFGVDRDAITIDHVAKAIATFERTIISGDSPFDRYEYGGQADAMSEAAIRGLDLFRNEGRCVSCHTISQTFALFTDSKFHNINVNFDSISESVHELATSFLEKKGQGADVDITVLTDKSASELGRYAVSEQVQDIGAFKTPTLRNIAVTAPYMHDGSLKTLKEVVEFYNNGGRVNPDDPINDFQSSGIRPLELTDQQIDDLVAFLEALTSPQYQTAQK